MSDTKLCPKCGQVLPVTEFCLSKASRDGRASYCRPCHRSYVEQRRRAKVMQPRPVRRVLESGETKECRSCHRVLDVSEFYPSTQYGDGRRNYGRACDLARAREWQAAHRERMAEIQRAYYRCKTGQDPAD